MNKKVTDATLGVTDVWLYISLSYKGYKFILRLEYAWIGYILSLHQRHGILINDCKTPCLGQRAGYNSKWKYSDCWCNMYLGRHVGCIHDDHRILEMFVQMVYIFTHPERKTKHIQNAYDLLLCPKYPWWISCQNGKLGYASIGSCLVLNWNIGPLRSVLSTQRLFWISNRIFFSAQSEDARDWS